MSLLPSFFVFLFVVLLLLSLVISSPSLPPSPFFLPTLANCHVIRMYDLDEINSLHFYHQTKVFRGYFPSSTMTKDALLASILPASRITSILVIFGGLIGLLIIELPTLLVPVFLLGYAILHCLFGVFGWITSLIPMAIPRVNVNQRPLVTMTQVGKKVSQDLSLSLGTPNAPQCELAKRSSGHDTLPKASPKPTAQSLPQYPLQDVILDHPSDLKVAIVGAGLSGKVVYSCSIGLIMCCIRSYPIFNPPIGLLVLHVPYFYA